MGWFESQIDTRARLDTAAVEHAYANLAASVSSDSSPLVFTVDDVKQTDGAVKACLRYIKVEPGAAPEEESDPQERIKWLCRPSGTMYRTVALEQDWYKQAFGAMLGKLDTGEAVALLPRGLHGYCYIEPGTGRKVKVDAQVASHIAKDAIMFYMPLPAKSLSIRDLIAFIMKIFDKGDYLLVLVASLVVTFIGLLPAWANQIAYGVVIPSGQARLVLPIAALLLGVAVSSTLIGIARSFVMGRVSMKLNVVIEAATYARVLALPTSFFSGYASGNLGNRIANMTQVANVITTILFDTALTALLSVVYIIQIGAYAPILALPALVIVLAQAGLTIAVTIATVSYEQRAMEENAKLSGMVTALLNGIQKVKLAGAEDRAFAKWANMYSEYARAMYNWPAVLRALPALVMVIGLLGTIGIYYLAGSTHVSYDSYMAFNVAFGQATAAIMAMAGASGQVARINPMLKLVEPVLQAVPEYSYDKPSVQSLSGGIEVSNLSFKYGEGQPYVVEDLSFRVRPGEYVALVGRSGCGKSTIMRLLLGFEKPERGTVFYGPHDVQRVDLRTLRQHIGVVMQDGKLFMGDIASNITISTPQATLDDAWEAAEIAGVAEDIRRMPMGMQTLITEGSGGVSGGQRQRLMIARAVCGKRSILMLDEATSALDNVTQKHVADSLEKLKCTRVVVAHRLSTVRHCDRILVVDEGRIVEEGTYEDLIARNGLFAELVARQRLDIE